MRVGCVERRMECAVGIAGGGMGNRPAAVAALQALVYGHSMHWWVVMAVLIAASGTSGCALNGHGVSHTQIEHTADADIAEIRSGGFGLSTHLGRSLVLGYRRDVYLAPPGTFRSTCAGSCWGRPPSGLARAEAVDRTAIGLRLGLSEPALGLMLGWERAFQRRRIDRDESYCGSISYASRRPEAAVVTNLGEAICDYAPPASPE